MNGSNRGFKNHLTAYLSLSLVILVLPELISGQWVIYLSKPLAMIYLLWVSIKEYRSPKTRNLVLGAILFSLAGDIILMFSGEITFLTGLGSFLVAQILYAVIFFKLGSKPTGTLSTRILLLGILAYLLLFMFYIKELVGDMFLPILIYALAISTMLSLATGLKDVVERGFGLMILVGAAFFVISDSLLAIDKFAQDLPMDRILIMATYLAAQYGIVVGLIGVQDGS